MSRTITIRFKSLLQNRQELAVENEAMVSTVYLAVLADGRISADQEVNLKMSAGASFEADKGSIEVLGDAEYDGPHNYQGFRDCVEAYYRALIGSSGTGIHIGPGASNIVMANSRFDAPSECSFETEDRVG